MMVTPVELLGGVAADLALGDPRWLPHPVSAIGRTAARMECLWRGSALPLRIAGMGAWLSVVSLACGAVYASLVLLPAPFIQIYWIFSFLAVRSLDDHAMAVVRALRTGDLPSARAAVSRIVGRDTADLDERGVTRALVETVSESLCDGVVAPLFWLLLGGPAAMAGYKSVNTLDSMFGHKNERYREFGWFSARMDDVANWIPARLTAALIWLVAAVWPGLRVGASVRATLRDARSQPSPNSGYPEAAAAGALGVRLGGVNYYDAVRTEKAPLGDEVRSLDWRVYAGLRVLLYGTALALTGLALGGTQWR